MRPINIPKKLFKFNKEMDDLAVNIIEIALNFTALKSSSPLISVIIPAYNEENNILKTLYSLSMTNTLTSVEIIVVNNNSIDQTEQLVNSCGLLCINETKQGIKYARNSGLNIARGKYILNADADTIYPAGWIDDMINPLINDQSICLTYGKFSFISVAKVPRWIYFFYENAADINRSFCRIFKEEAVNVYGFNFGCRTAQCLSVNGFNHPPGTNEDGWLAMKLRAKGYGKFYCVTADRSIVWTSDRRIQIDGGLFKASFDRVLRKVNALFKRNHN